MIAYSLVVSLYDCAAPAVTAAGTCCLANAIAQRRKIAGGFAWCAAFLITLGGACKASWKIMIAFNLYPPDALQGFLFIALAPGFITLALCLHQALPPDNHPDSLRYLSRRISAWIAPPMAIALMLSIARPETRIWFFWLLGVTTVAYAMLVRHALRAARMHRLGKAVNASLIYSFIATVALAALARLPAGEAAAWLQETVNLSAQLALAFGLWQVSHHINPAQTPVQQT